MEKYTKKVVFAGIGPIIAHSFGGVPGFDEGTETQGACRGADYLVNTTATTIVANDDNYALAA